MTKKNLTIIIILLAIIDLVAAGWYMSRRIEAGASAQDLFSSQRDTTDVIAMADTLTSAMQADEFEELQHNTYYFTANTPSITGDNTSCYTSTKHVKVRWPLRINGDEDLDNLNKELIKTAFGSTHTQLKDARYAYLNSPEFNHPVGDDYRTLVKAPTVYPVYGNVSQVLVYPCMTSQRLLVMEVDKVTYDGSSNDEERAFVHYDRMRGRVLSRMDILATDANKENKLLKVINTRIDDLNKGRGEERRLQHALNVPADICCNEKGVLFLFKNGSIASGPVEVLINYDKMQPYFTEDFKQLQASNEGYQVYDEKIKPEPINQARQATVKKPAVVNTPAPQVKKPKATKSNYYKTKKKYYRNYRNSGKGYYVKPARTKKKRYSGAGRKSVYRGYSGQQHSRRHRR